MVRAKTLPDDSHAFWVRCVCRKISTDECCTCSMGHGHLVRLLHSESIDTRNWSNTRQRHVVWYLSAAKRHVRRIPLNEGSDRTIFVVRIAMCCCNGIYFIVRHAECGEHRKREISPWRRHFFLFIYEFHHMPEYVFQIEFHTHELNLKLMCSWWCPALVCRR